MCDLGSALSYQKGFELLPTTHTEKIELKKRDVLLCSYFFLTYPTLKY